MASTKISDETAASALDGTELVPVVQGGANRRTTTQDIADLAAGDVILDADVADTASVAAASAASFFRNDLDGPSTPTGTAFVDTIDDPALGSTRQCLRVGATSCQGGFLFALAGLPTLPTAGYSIDVDIADMSPSGGNAAIGIMYEDYDLGGTRDAPRGLIVEVYKGATNINLQAVRLESTDYTRVDLVDSMAWASTPSDAEAEAGGWRLAIDVRRVNNANPACYAVRVTAYSGNGAVSSESWSNVAAPITDLASKTFAKIGLGCYCNGAAADSWIAVRRMRVRNL